MTSSTNILWPEDMSAIEQEFRAVRKLVLAEKEAAIEHKRAEVVALREGADQDTQDQLNLLEAIGLDTAKLEELEQKEQGSLDAFVAKARPRLVDSERPDRERLRERLLYCDTFSRAGALQPTLIGADLVSSTPESLGEEEGKERNLSVWKYDAMGPARDVEVRCAGSGPMLYGMACGTGGEREVIWYYYWVPEYPGQYYIWTFIPYSGVYLVRSRKRWYNNKFARVRAAAEMSVWHSGHRRARIAEDIVKLKKRAGESSGTLDGQKDPHTTLLLGANLVVFTVGVSVEGVACGSGCLAEVDFATGSARSVGPPYIFITHQDISGIW